MAPPSTAMRPDASGTLSRARLCVCVPSPGVCGPIPGKALYDHLASDIVPCMPEFALRDDPIVSVAPEIVAGDIVREEPLKLLGGLSSGRISIGTHVAGFGRVNAPKAVFEAASLECIAVDNSDGWLGCRGHAEQHRQNG